MPKTITMTLDALSIDKAIAEIRAYEKEVTQKTRVLRETVAEKIRDRSAERFAGAPGEDIITSRPEGYVADKTVTVDKREEGDESIVYAEGKEAVFIEFGAGIHHNGNVGGSPHPWGLDLGFTIGGYGKNYGSRHTWRFIDGEFGVMTHGTPASMPMYNSVQETRGELETIAKDVFRH